MKKNGMKGKRWGEREQKRSRSTPTSALRSRQRVRLRANARGAGMHRMRQDGTFVRILRMRNVRGVLTPCEKEREAVCRERAERQRNGAPTSAVGCASGFALRLVVCGAERHRAYGDEL